jgi:hypothetical protein
MDTMWLSSSAQSGLCSVHPAGVGPVRLCQALDFWQSTMRTSSEEPRFQIQAVDMAR